jgi:hypothetical protein
MKKHLCTMENSFPSSENELLTNLRVFGSPVFLQGKSQFSEGNSFFFMHFTNEKTPLPLGAFVHIVNIYPVFPSQKFLRVQFNLYF